jgi:hypothetical protein
LTRGWLNWSLELVRCGAALLWHRTWRRERWEGAALALLALLLLLLGVLTAGIGSTTLPVLAVVHNAFAAAVVVLLSRLA